MALSSGAKVLAFKHRARQRNAGAARAQSKFNITADSLLIGNFTHSPKAEERDKAHHEQR